MGDVLKVLVAFAIQMWVAEASDDMRRAETERIQGEIDRVAAQGGGRVVIAKGEHPCGTLYLKSGVELHLEEGAVLLGSERSGDYDDAIPKAEMYDYEQMAPESRSLKAFIYAQGATNIAITGRGTIDGQGSRFFDHSTVLWERFWAKPKVHRPRMVVLFGCKGVRLDGVTFKDCPVWTMWLRDCEDVAADGIVIDCEQKMINSDGIDLDCCRHVRVGNSRLKTGDDGFAIRAIRSKVDRQRPAVTEDVVVSNCFIDSACQGVRIGCPSDDTIRNCLFKDIVFRGYNAIGLQQPTWYLEAGDSGYLRTEDIVFDGWDIDCQGHALEMFVSDGISLRDFGHFAFRNFKIKAGSPAVIRDGDKTKIGDLVFENILGRTEGLPCPAGAALPEARPWLIVNEDNDHYFKGPSELMTEKALCDYIDYTCKGKVTHFFMCPSGQRASFDSKTWEPIWAGVNEPDHSGRTNNLWCANARLLHDCGIDPYAVWAKRCRERGVSPWLSMRMNDVHFCDITNYFRNTTFCRTRKDLWINPGGKDWADTSLDYAQQEVRDYNLAHLREIASRWDVDGVELDWMRFGRHLRPGRERSDAHFLDDFLRQVRRTLDEIGARRGRRLSLGVRVCRDPDLAISKMGMNVAKWAEEGLVDLVVPHSFYKTDSGIAVAKWKERIIAANPKVRVIPGIDYLASIGGKDVWMTPEMYRGVAAKFWKAGAQGIYLFNLPYRGKYRADGERLDCDVADVIFREGLDPSAIDGKKCAEVEVFHDF